MTTATPPNRATTAPLPEALSRRSPISSRVDQTANLPCRPAALVCSVRQVAKCLDRPAWKLPPLEAVRLSVATAYAALASRQDMATTNPTAGGAALVRQRAQRAANGARLTPEWARFRDGLERPYESAV